MARTSAKKDTTQPPTELPPVVVESNEDRFKRIAGRRTQGLLKGMQSLGKCAGPGYAFTEVQVEKMLQALELQLAGVRQVFAARSTTGFSWDEDEAE